MFSGSKAFSGFAVPDIEAARKFYGETLGLKVSEDNDMGLLTLHLATGADVMIYPTPDHQPAVLTILNFPVENIDQAVDQLTERGVTMVRYSGIEGIEQDEKGVARDPRGPQIAWFTDPAGNVLSVLQAS